MTSVNCSKCPFRNQPRVPSEGNPKTCKYILVGEAPGSVEVRLQRPFVGPTGRTLNAFLARAGISRSDCYLMNALSCPVSSKSKINEAVSCCRPRVLAELESIDTKATICLMGKVARNALYLDEQGGILASRGWREWQGRSVLVMAHPAFFLYNPNEAPLLLKDLQRLKRGRLEAPTVEYEVLDSKELLEEFIASLHRKPMKEKGYIAFDIETMQIDYQRDRVLCLSVSPEYGRALIIPDSLLYRDGIEWVTTDWSKHKWERFLNDERYQSGEYLRPNYNTVALLSVLFNIPGYTYVGHNCKFDLRFLVGQLGMSPPVSIADTIVMHYTLDERQGGHALKGLADDYLDSGDYEADLFKYIAKKSGHYSNIPRRVLYKYNVTDTELTLRLAYLFEKELKKQGLYERPYKFPMLAALPMLLNTELCGVSIDWKEMERIDEEEIEPELQEVARELREISGHPELNPLSSARVNDIIYDELGFPIIEVRTKAAGKRLKARSSRVAVIDGWAKLWEQGRLPVTKEAWRFVEMLRYYRHIRKMRGSYVRKWQHYRGTDDRVHTSFLLRGTVTGRLSSKDPPLQTIPSKVTDKWGPLIANAHIPKSGWKFLYADFSQAELMTAACLSGDKFMIQSFRKENADYHSEVARAAFGEDFTRDERQACKRLTFGWLYGGNVRGIAMDALQFEGAVAERFAHEWDDLFKEVLAWRRKQAALMQKQGYVESVFGRRRRYLFLTKDNIGKAKRVAVNAPIQSAVSDLTLVSAIRLHAKYKGRDFAHTVLLIHDAVVMEVRDDHIVEVGEAMQRTMLETAAEYFPQVPFRADVKVGTRLGDLT